MNAQNQEAVLIIEFVDGAKFAVQMPGITAKAMGAALLELGEKTSRPDDSKTN